MYGIQLNEAFSGWIAALVVITILVELALTIVIRAYYLNKAYKCDSLKTAEKYCYSATYEPDYFINSVMEIMLSNTIVFSTLFIHARIVNATPYISDDWHSLFLLLLIVLAIFVNNIVDKLWLNRRWLRAIESDAYDTGSLRLMSLLSTLIITVFAALVYGIDSSIINSIGLMILGRFICFDSSRGDFKESIKKIFQTWKSFLVTLLFTGGMLISGFYYKVLTSDQFIIGFIVANVAYFICTEIAIKIWNDIATMKK